jgi:hypothetical protein
MVLLVLSADFSLKRNRELTGAYQGITEKTHKHRQPSISLIRTAPILLSHVLGNNLSHLDGVLGHRLILELLARTSFRSVPHRSDVVSRCNNRPNSIRRHALGSKLSRADADIGTDTEIVLLVWRTGSANRCDLAPIRVLPSHRANQEEC